MEAVRTQVSKDRTRPDLVGYDCNGNERVLVEAKFWAGLTDNQPNAYLERLPDDDLGSSLLVIAPAKRLQTLWIELCRLAGVPCEASPGELKVASIGDTKRLVLTSWRFLLLALSKQASLRGDYSLDADIAQLSSLCELQDQEAFLPLRAEEFTPAIPRRLLQLNALVDDATEAARQAGIANTDRLVRTPQAFGYGRYLKLGLADRDTWAGAWFGVHQELWKSAQETPPWLAFSAWDGTLPIAGLRHRLGEDTFVHGDNLPLCLPRGVERDAVLDDIVKQLHRIAIAIGDGGTAIAAHR